ncbi:MAG: 1-acyl-sn-glycerol-3-phosphate acyltransferase, partial [Streptomyces sp.]
QRAVTDEVMYEIMKLSGQVYVDTYATAAKRQLAEEAKRAAEAEKEAAKGAGAGQTVAERKRDEPEQAA